MAKIDIEKIEGYADMTPEQKLAALEAFEYEDNASELQRYKGATTKANSEAAEWKKKYNALLSEEERKKNASEEELNNIRTELENLRNEKSISENKAHFISLGYDEALAGETAKAMSSGDIATVFANQKKFLEDRDKTIKAELLKATPTPPAGKGDPKDFEARLAEARKAGNTAAAVMIKREAAESGVILN